VAAELTEPLGWVGLDWPAADEELLFEAGQQWIAYGEQLAQIAQRADAVAGGVWSSSSGEAAEAFRAWWTEGEGPARRLAEDAAAALLIGAALVAFAVVTLALKINFVVQLVILAVEVAQAIATAFVTFGATMAEVPGFVAATRVICRQLIKQVVSHVQTVIKDILARAKDLLKKAKNLKGKLPGRTALDDAGHGVSIPPALRDRRYSGKPMNDRYRTETNGADPSNPFRPSSVRRLTEVERESHRLYFDQDGVLRSARDGTAFDTRASMTEHSGSGRAIFVMDEQGNLYASNYQKIGVFHHSTLANGQPVATAGEISVLDGRIQHFTAASGHYTPGRAEMQQLVDELDRNGVQNVPVYGFDGETLWF
jgi:hypothetical protein